MIKYNNKNFKDYIELELYMINTEKNIREKFFRHSSSFYIRSHLKEKFNRDFSFKEIRELLAEEIALGHITLKGY